MKKLIYISLAFVFLLIGAQNTFASGPFNGQSGDCPSIAIGNYTTGNGIGNGQWNCWTKTSVTASAGDTINVSLFYHNNTANTLTDVRASLSQSSDGPTTHYSFSGNMYSDQGNTSLGTVHLNLNSSQTLTYSSAHWMKDKDAIDSDSDSSMLYGQDEDVMEDGGQIRLGSVPPGWEDYGQLIVVFKVGENNDDDDNDDDNNCSISSFYASDTTIEEDDDTTLHWNTNDCDHVTITDLGSVDDDGSEEVSPNSDRTYVIKAYNSDGSYESDSVKIYVDESDNDTCVISDFEINNDTDIDIKVGDSAKLRWNTSGCDHVTVSGLGFYSTDLDGSETVYPYNSGTYILKGYNSNGSVKTKTVYVSVNAYQNPVIVAPVSCAVTTIATNVGQNSVTLNGLVTGDGNNTYFEYGPSINLGSRTNARSVDSNVPFSEAITGLNAKTSYFFRLVSNCNGGISYGKIEAFTTSGGQVITQRIVTEGKTIVGTSSPIMLKIENRYEYIGVGDTIDYTVTYKNISKMKLTQPVLQVIAPRDIVLQNASRGTYSNETNTLTVLLEDLMPGDEGTVYLQGVVNSISSRTSQIVTTAILVYTAPNKAQENAIAYVLNNPKDYNNNLGAAAFFGGIFNFGIIGWLLLLILIMMIILFSRSVYDRKTTTKTVTVNEHH